MITPPAAQLVQLRLDQANESLQEAETLYRSSLWRGSINRAYYAMFYAVLALAVFRQEITSKHSGVISFFDREFVKSGIFPRELSRCLHLAFQRRQESDYGSVFAVNQEDVQQALTDARTFVGSLEAYLKKVIGVGSNSNVDPSG